LPLTPFHIGPALGVKAAARRYFSLRVFALAQVIMDLEAVRAVILNTYPLHGPLHSLVGGTLAGMVAAGLGRYAFNVLNPPTRAHLRRIEGMPAWLVEEVAPITWAAALMGGVVGGLSHVLLDAIIGSVGAAAWLAVAKGAPRAPSGSP
jgi:hypothetical protein